MWVGNSYYWGALEVAMSETIADAVLSDHSDARVVVVAESCTTSEGAVR